MAPAALVPVRALVLVPVGRRLVLGRLLVLVVTPLSRLPLVVVVVPLVWVAWAVWALVWVRAARMRSTSVPRTSLSRIPTACSVPTR
jgi:hypothetical protein